MIEMTDTARDRFDSYLSRLRRALSGARSVEADDVEQNVRDHIDFALAGTPAPVGAEHLGAVLDRLGPPERWLPEDELPAWKRALNRMRTGPEDWRLAYLSFGLFLAMFVFLPIGGALLLIPGFVVSRAYVSLMEEKGEAIGARKWLVFPSMVMMLLLVAVLVLIGPAAGAIAWGVEERGLYSLLGVAHLNYMQNSRITAGFVLTVIGLWWIIASAILAIVHRPLRVFFRPLLDRHKRAYLLGLGAIGLVLGGIGLTLLLT